MTNASTRRAAAAAVVVAVVLALASTAVAAAASVTGSRVAPHDHAAAAVVAASTDVLAGQGRAATTEAAKEAVGSRVAPQTAVRGGAGPVRVGQQGLDALGITQNTTRIPSMTGTAAYRVPDALSDVVLTEVKNVSRLGLTPQIQDFMYYATQTGRRFDLYVRQGTVLTRELEGVVNMTGSPINLIRAL